MNLRKKHVVTADEHTKAQVLSILMQRPEEHVNSARIQNLSPVAIDKRTIAAAARELRRQGYMIGSSTDGYYFTTDPEKYDEAIGFLWSRVIDMIDTIHEMRSAQYKNHPSVTELL
jgi:hypothetical protein